MYTEALAKVCKSKKGEKFIPSVAEGSLPETTSENEIEIETEIGFQKRAFLWKRTFIV